MNTTHHTRTTRQIARSRPDDRTSEASTGVAPIYVDDDGHNSIVIVTGTHVSFHPALAHNFSHRTRHSTHDTRHTTHDTRHTTHDTRRAYRCE